MLRHTFIHVPGIGLTTERRLWEAGILSWDDLDGSAAAGLPAGRRALLRAHCGRRLSPRDLAALLPAAQHWRLFPHFRHAAACLDIETNGAGPWAEEITAISLWDGSSLFCFVQGDNLEMFPETVERYEMLITYNGKCFDLPVIERQFGIRLEQLHLDLRFLLAHLGYKGGLKGCEKRFGLDRGELDGVDGYFAVLLWQEYLRSGNPRALETLLAYNVEDTVNLETLMVHAFNLNVAATPFADRYRLPLPVRPVHPYRADPLLVGRLKALLQN
ncbi:MAG: ribonuclease H-like domain-containing protein [Desulfobacteraceae bacterium]|nr:ribonuclease H-like domain-containing protein [Desulfobacteraceae bacterium]